MVGKRIIVKKVYKKIKVPIPHCSVCGERLKGEGSECSPYKCECGTWNYDWLRNEYWVLK
jgi:tRNA(Ile2) C34 agmatinyltransferase TiaS